MLRVALALLLAGLVPASSAYAKPSNPLKLVVEPRPVNACTYLTLGFDGEFSSETIVKLKLTNAKAAGTFWESAPMAVVGAASRRYQIRPAKHWPPTNTNDGAAYKLEAYVDGDKVKEVGVPIHEIKNNTPPTALGSTIVFDEDIIGTGTLFAYDPDGEALLFDLAAGSPHGQISVDSHAGTFTFTPEANWFGETSFVFSVEDCKHTVYGTVDVTVRPVNDPPVVQPVAVRTLEDLSITGILTGSDIENDPLTFELGEQSPNGTALVLPDGGFEFLGAPDWFGTTQFTFRAFDGELYSNVGTVTVDVTPVNDPPVALSADLSTLEDTALTGPLMATDVDSGALTYELLQQPIAGVVLVGLDGSFVYTPSQDYNGPDSFTFKANDGELDSLPATIHVSVTPVNDPPVAFALEITGVGNADLVGVLEADDIDSPILTYHVFESPAHGTLSLDSQTGAFTFSPDSGWHGDTSFAFFVSDGESDSEPATVQIAVITGGGTEDLPPDPATVAPPLDLTVISSVYDSTAFLYTGDSPIQRGVEPGTIVPHRAGVIRGRVLDVSGTALSGAVVRILNHPEYGWTKTRLDGRFDLAVNGGGLLTLAYEKPGYLPIQRKVRVPWDMFVEASEVVLTAYDAVSTVVDLSLHQVQYGQSRIVEDAGGPRRTTVVFPAGTEAVARLPDGSTTSLSSLTLRITEFTVGENGPKAMPGELPPTVLYTYAVELSVDEALALGSDWVEFSQPVALYLDDFLDLGAGAVIPVGYFDRLLSAWVPSQDGFVLTIVGVDGGEASIDINGDGLAEPPSFLDTLGVSADERGLLAQLYPVGKSLWRAETRHFTPLDLNHGFGTNIDNARGPDVGGPPPPPPDDDCKIAGSIIGCESQVLGEAVRLVGLGERLSYRSDRVPGRAGRFEVPLRGTVGYVGAKSVLASATVAGRTFFVDFDLADEPNPVFVVDWDARDAYGRRVQGKQKVHVRLTYVYDVPFYTVFEWCAKATTLGCQLNSCSEDGKVCTFTFGENQKWKWVLRDTDRTPRYTTYSKSQEFTFQVGGYDAEALSGVGGWSFSNHHFYDYRNRILIPGGESPIHADQTLGGVIRTIAGRGTSRADGAPAVEWDLSHLRDLVVAGDGTIFLAHVYSIREMSNGTIRTIAGTESYVYNGDGLPALATNMMPTKLALGDDGSLYFVDGWNRRVRRLAPDGRVYGVAGNGQPGQPIDGMRATESPTGGIVALDVGRDGTVYFMQAGVVYRITHNGYIRRVAGGGTTRFYEGVPALDVSLSQARDMKVDADGQIFVTSTYLNIIYRIDTNGAVHRIAGGGLESNDGIPAVEASLSPPLELALAPDGTVFFVTTMHQVKMVRPDGILGSFAGQGMPGFSGDGDRATKALLYLPRNVNVGPNGEVVFFDGRNVRIRAVGASLPGFDYGTHFIASDDGALIYVFEPNGRHQKTVDARTGVTIYEFLYTRDGRLAGYINRDGQTTEVIRDSDGKAVGVRSPYGQVTNLSLDEDGYLIGIESPDGNRFEVGYEPGGLLVSFQKPNGSVSTYDYTADGKLVSAWNAIGGEQKLAKTSSSSVSVSDPLGRMSYMNFDMRLPDGGTSRSVVSPDGTATEMGQDTSGNVTSEFPDGSVQFAGTQADPRFALQAPFQNYVEVRMPSGLTQVRTAQTETVLGETILDLISEVKTSSSNGREFSTSYLRDTRTETSITPAGRTSQTVFDSMGRVSENVRAGIVPTEYIYSPQGLLIEVRQGTRRSILEYDAFGRVALIRDTLGRETIFTFDPDNRVVAQSLPDGRNVGFAYDRNGNLTSVTPPGKTAHLFSFSPVDLVTGYDAPDAADGAGVTTYDYNLAKQLVAVNRPDGVTVEYLYEGDNDSRLPLPNPNTGRLKKIVQPRGETTFGYDSAGRLANVTAPDGGLLSYAYDGSLLLSTTWNNGDVNGIVSRTYDNNFWVTSESVNGANTVGFTYDLDGLLTGANTTVNGSAVNFVIARDPDNGLITGSSIGGVADSISYNGFAEPIGYSATCNGTAPHCGSTPFYDVSYVRDAIGRISSKTETVNGVTTTYGYHYDLAGRLTGVDENGVPSSTYTYDSNGNRLSYTKGSTTLNGTYDAQDRLLSYGDFVYEYTANGELRRKENVVTGEVWDYSYDEFGNLLLATLPDGTVIEYVVDAQDRRIGKKVNGQLGGGYLYRGKLKVVAELNSFGHVISRYIYGDRDNVPSYMIRGGKTYRIMSDQIGSVRLVVDTSNGMPVQQIDYDEYGNVLEDTNKGFQPFGYAGGIYDQDTGLVRFGARDYDPVAGRWTLKDPIGFDGGDLNLYGYVFGDPINLIDPNGKNIFEGCLPSDDKKDKKPDPDEEKDKEKDDKWDDEKKRDEYCKGGKDACITVALKACEVETSKRNPWGKANCWDKVMEYCSKCK